LGGITDTPKAVHIVVAPSLIPMGPGDQVKTDRRDAIRLAQLLRERYLTEVWVLGEEDEVLRDLVKSSIAKENFRRVRQRVVSFLLRHGVELSQGTKRWSVTLLRWMDKVKLLHQSTQTELQKYLAEERKITHRVERKCP
jgi:transposase